MCDFIYIREMLNIFLGAGSLELSHLEAARHTAAEALCQHCEAVA